MKISTYSTIILFWLVALVTPGVFAQSPSLGGPPPIGGYRSPSADPNIVRRNERPRGEAPPINDTSWRVNSRPVPLFKPESKLNAKERMLLATYPEDQKKYAEFLREPGTGLFRLLPYSGNVVTVETLKTTDVLLPIKGRGAYYSYSKLRHELDDWSEIGLQNGMFQVGFVSRSLAFMGVLGDVPLESITLDSREVVPLHKLDPAPVYQDMIAQGDKNTRFLKAGGFIYGSSVAALPNNTYVLRSTISYKADLLIAFRVIRQDDDGSLHILWKKLASYPLPTLDGKKK
jgi:hypothetical protein